MATIDQQFVEYIVKTLVNNPDKVVVERSIDEKGVLLSLTVDPEDVGRIIGKRGMTAQAMRVLLRALGSKQNARYNLKIVNDEETSHREARPATERGAHHAEETFEAEANEESASGITENTEVDSAEDETSELAEKTRAELADLDDLDI